MFKEAQEQYCILGSGIASESLGEGVRRQLITASIG